ncbi:MAG: TauD/TfdA family dioxygenase [Rhodoferax sp.]|nr:TauD/TfdA family dioxygenase [Rhodoferax sp.]
MDCRGIKVEKQRPTAWYSAEVAADTSWVKSLSGEEIDGFDLALRHAKKSGKSFLEMGADDFPLSKVAARVLHSAFAATQGRWGMCLLKGFPVTRWSEDDVRLVCWGIGLHVGVARTQNRQSQFLNDVRDEGGSYREKNGRGYNTNAALDFHIDSCDVVALLCRRSAKAGGHSKVTSSIALRDEVLRLRPDLAPVLEQPFYHSYQGAQAPGLPEYYKCPVFGKHPEYFSLRTNRKTTTSAQTNFPDVPRFSAEQIEALDLLDQLLPDPRLCYSMDLEPGDLQLLNNYVVIHSRTDFEDHDTHDAKRHLVRLWLAIPQSQPLPEEWKEYYSDIRAGAVRGGLRGSAMSEAFLQYERRQAAAMGMPLMQPEARAPDGPPSD